MRPVHRGAQRLLAADCGARTTGQQPEPVMQAVDDLGQGQRSHPRRREFDRQRHAVEAAAISATAVELSSVTAKSGRARRARSANSSIASSASDSEGTCHITSPVTLTGSRLVANTVTPGRSRQSSPSNVGARVEEVLAVVQHHQQVTPANESQQSIHRRTAGLVGQAQSAGDGHRHHLCGRDRRQIDVPDAVAEFARHLGGHLQGQPCLAHPAGPDQGDQPVACQGLPQAADFCLAPNETR